MPHVTTRLLHTFSYAFAGYTFGYVTVYVHTCPFTHAPTPAFTGFTTYRLPHFTTPRLVVALLITQFVPPLHVYVTPARSRLVLNSFDWICHCSGLIVTLRSGCGFALLHTAVTFAWIPIPFPRGPTHTVGLRLPLRTPLPTHAVCTLRSFARSVYCYRFCSVYILRCPRI